MNEKKIPPVDVTNKELMVKENLHQPPAHVRDESVWTKTPKEKAALKKAKARTKSKFAGGWVGESSNKVIPVAGKLIIYPKGESCISHNCNQDRIPRILARYRAEGRYINKYSFNGVTYSPTELPFWKPKVKNGISMWLRN